MKYIFSNGNSDTRMLLQIGIKNSLQLLSSGYYNSFLYFILLMMAGTFQLIPFLIEIDPFFILLRIAVYMPLMNFMFITFFLNFKSQYIFKGGLFPYLLKDSKYDIINQIPFYLLYLFFNILWSTVWLQPSNMLQFIFWLLMLLYNFMFVYVIHNILYVRQLEIIDIAKNEEHTHDILKNRRFEDFRFKLKNAMLVLIVVWIGNNLVVYILENFLYFTSNKLYELMIIDLTVLIIIICPFSIRIAKSHNKRKVIDIIKANWSFGKLFGISGSQIHQIPYLLKSDSYFFSFTDIHAKVLLTFKHLFFSTIYAVYVYGIVEVLVSRIGSNILPQYFFVGMVGLPILLKSNLTESIHAFVNGYNLTRSSIKDYIVFHFLVYGVYPSVLMSFANHFNAQIIYLSVLYSIMLLQVLLVNFMGFFNYSDKKVWTISTVITFLYIPILFVVQNLPILLFPIALISLYFISMIKRMHHENQISITETKNTGIYNSRIESELYQKKVYSTKHYENQELFDLWLSNFSEPNQSAHSFLISFKTLTNETYNLRNNLAMILMVFHPILHEINQIIDRLVKKFSDTNFKLKPNNLSKLQLIKIISYALEEVGLSSFILLDYDEDLTE